MPDVKARGRTKVEEPNVESANEVQWEGSQYKKGHFLCLNQGVEDLEDLSYLQESDFLSFLRPIEARKLLSLLRKSSQQDVLDSPPSNQSNQQFRSTSTSPVTQSDEMHLSAQNSTCPQKTHPPLHEQPLCLSADSVKRTLAAINTRKATGPDNIPGRGAEGLRGELKDVFTDIFNTSLKQAIVPSCFKAATIIPVRRKLLHPASMTTARGTDTHHHEVL
ncbi:hypothetical protein AALO_G00240970 [Alosa alosa]|uniref:Uncharacterized protein n=1 Tax=Alosa alosa TaxID=278164 RepID=A0AAV6FU96_9TELE|nr:hypothetical protein AALO_G00240970 [Alosa alosa]